jgi:putative DNA primase/helicase
MATVAERQAPVDAIHAEVFGERQRKRSAQPGPAAPNTPTNVDDAALLDKARKAKDGAKFAALYYRGDWQGQGYPSQSEADLWLAGKLAFWTARDRSRIDSLFRSSALMREKWDRDDYRQRTVDGAIAGCPQVYRPRRTVESDHAQSSDAAANGGLREARHRCGRAQADGPAAEPDEDNEPDPPAKYSDIALSNRFVKEHGRDLRFVKELGSWLIYCEQESRWVADRKFFPWALAKRMLAAVAHEVYEEVMRTANANHSKVMKLASIIASASKLAAVVNLARSHKKIAATMEQFDLDPCVLNTRGGVVNLKDGSIRPGRRQDYFTKVAPVAPRRIPTPIFDKFMFEIMGGHIPSDVCSCAACATSFGQPAQDRQKSHDAEVERLKNYILRIYGYALSGDVSEHALFLEIGEGGNGKGLLNDLISEDIMGTYPSGYSCNIPIEALLAAKGERHPTELMDLWKSRLALARESDEGTRWNEGRVKALTGGDRLKARRMRQDFVEFPPTHKLVVFGNSKPTLRGADQSAWKRRLHMIMFPQKFDDTPDDSKNILKADKGLRDRLRAEAPGILQLLIDGCLERNKLNSFDPPQTVREASSRFLAEQNVIAQWLAERCDMSDPYGTASVNELWADCSKWAEPRKEYIGRRNEFNDRLERAGIRITRTGGQRGICKEIKLRAQEAAGAR